MNLYTNSPLIQNGQKTFFTKFVMTKLLVLVFVFSLYSRPAPAQGLFLIALTLAPLIIIDNNSCWVNLIWGCDSDEVTSAPADAVIANEFGVIVSSSSVKMYYESNYPPADDKNGLVPLGGSGGSPRESLDSQPCTQGKTCPGDELGDVVVKNSVSVNPAFANSQTNTCPLLWTPGKDNSLSVLSCKLITNGVATDLPVKSGSVKNTFQIPPAKHILSCSRTTTEVVTQYGAKDGDTERIKIREKTNVFTTIEDYNIKCNAIPDVIEI